MNAKTHINALEKAREEAYATPLETMDVAQPDLFRDDVFWPFFERLRAEAPVHYCPESIWGPYWSVTKYKDIQYVDTHHKLFSSEPSITIAEPMEDLKLSMFIAMDPPKHDHQRREVSPAVAPVNLATLESTIRERVRTIIDGLPRNEPFDWVDRVSIELTAQMLATILGYPQEDRRQLTRWSDVATANPLVDTTIVETEEEKKAELLECLKVFTGIWNERVNAPPQNDMISMLAHGESTRNMDPMEFLGNLVLLIVGGNDTTRNSLSGGLYALNKYPGEYDKLMANPGLVKSLIPEIIRWQTPLAHMRRIATEDTELGGKTIRKGDKVVMWYVSGNRDDEVIERPDDLIIDRANPRQHLSFGYGIHRCMGNRLAEMQLRVFWEEVIARVGKKIEVLEEPTRTRSAFVKGYTRLMVRIPD